MPLAKQLANEFAVYAPDLPGHGKSDTPRRPLNVVDLADSLVAWMDAMRLEDVSLVANSMGCQLAVDAAARYPRRIHRLVLIGPAGDPAARTLLHQVERFLADIPHEPASLAPLVFFDYVRMGLRFFAEFRSMLQDPIGDKLPLLTVPVLLIRGEHDPIAPRAWLDEAARQIGTACTIAIPAGGHAVHYSAAKVVADTITPFLHGSLAGCFTADR